LSHLEDILTNQRNSTAFLAIDDTDDGVTIKRGGGYYNRRAIFVYVLKKFNTKSQEDREEKVAETRLIHKSLLSKLIIDKNSVDGLMFLDENRIPYHEVPGMFVAETCGLYFSFTIEEPTNLVYDANDWE
ncbi:MAG TPA: hypothetical protein VI413_10775, partial [Paludibacter sp.]